jgi:precorrin-6Y C5,15-methyltransferase (decarboxylating)
MSRVTIIGIGPGSADLLTAEAKEALASCDAVLGAESVVDSLEIDKPVYFEYLPEKVKDILDSHPEIKNAALVMRGDVGFYSGAKKLREAIPDAALIPGIASPILFAADLGISWDDAALISLHGKDENPILKICRNIKTFILTGGNSSPKSIISKLIEYGLGDLKVTVGENLSCENERYTAGTASQLEGMDFDPLSIVFVENPYAEKAAAIGIPDDEFIRGDVPMTKAEIRAVSLSKLKIKNDSIIWDVGAGTGSVSVECALLAEDGKVYAIEKKAEAVDLIRQNRIKFRTDNIIDIVGEAPEALADLPAPDCVFIGGSSGNLEQIIDTVLEKNRNAVIVVNAITLETQTEASSLAKRFEEFEAVSVSVSRSRAAGDYHLMNSLNPVWIFTMRGGR